MNVGFVIVGILLLILIDSFYLYKENSQKAHTSAFVLAVLTLLGTYYMAVKGSDSLFEVVVKGGLVGVFGYGAFNRSVIRGLDIKDNRSDFEFNSIYAASICSITASLLYLMDKN
jgi:hypothetical protein